MREFMSNTLAIVIPCGPGEIAWRELLLQLNDLAALETVLVVPDGEQVALDQPGVTLVHSRIGRGVQMNAGAAATQSDWLWFLHADSRIDAATTSALHRFMAADRDEIGYFDLAFLDDGPRMVFLNERLANLRSRWLRLPFGDQGFLMHRRVFQALGGFSVTLQSGEDHALIWSARKRSVGIVPLRAPLYTSARKYARKGWSLTSIGHVWQTLHQVYRFSRRHPKS